MAATEFFINWALWQQMSFVLACGILLVLLLGLGKLWWMNRHTRKHEVLDEEKRQRVIEMRKSGLEPPKKKAIPFGVRAIQSGIEVDGIWISRPSSPSEDMLKELVAARKNSTYTDAGGNLSTIRQTARLSALNRNSYQPTGSRSTGAKSQGSSSYVPKSGFGGAATDDESGHEAALRRLEGNANASSASVGTYKPKIAHTAGGKHRLTRKPIGDDIYASSENGTQSTLSFHATQHRNPFRESMRALPNDSTTTLESPQYFDEVLQNPFTTPEHEAQSVPNPAVGYPFAIPYGGSSRTSQIRPPQRPRRSGDM